jgi:flagellar export protein FliJ
MPPYRLQTLYEMRQRAEEEAKQRFSEATRALFKVKEELARLEADLVRREKERREKIAAYVQEVIKKGVGAGGLTMMNRFEERLKDEETEVKLEIEKQKELVKAAEKKLEQRRREMAEAAKDVKAIEKHKEKWQKQIRYERDMREETAQEEIGSALHLARERKLQ